MNLQKTENNFKTKIMRNYKKYRSTVISLFQSFLAGKIDKTDFLFSLSEIETKLKGDVISKKGLWFKFFKGDTGATTVWDLYINLDNTTNDKYEKECMQIAIDNPKGLQIYYS